MQSLTDPEVKTRMSCNPVVSNASQIAMHKVSICFNVNEEQIPMLFQLLS